MERDNRATSGANAISLTSELIDQFPCPFLGVPGDRNSVLGYPSSRNRCFASLTPDPVDLDKQRVHCLSDSFSDCPVIQQAIFAPTEVHLASEEKKSFSQILSVRTLALVVISTLFLLTALIWWPVPELNLHDRNVQSEPLNRNLQDAKLRDMKPAVQNEVSQTINVREQRNPATSIDEVNQSNDSIQGYGISAVANSRPIEESDFLSREDQSAPALQSLQSTAEDEADSEIIRMSTRTAVRDQYGKEIYAEKDAYRSESTLQITISDLPDLYQAFQIQQEDNASDAKSNSDFSPIAYNGQGVLIPLFSDASDNRETLPVYHLPDAENDEFITLSRFELVNVLGRYDMSNWLKIRTESGIEGWIRAANSGLGGGVEAVPEIEYAGGAIEVLSVPTSLPMIRAAATRQNSLIVRSAPGADFERIASIEKGIIVELLGRWQDGPWVRIRIHDGTEGWVEADALTAANY